ncbi:MAG: hypothetical protein ACYC27_15090 [Armatimonadota bacterium]
MESEVGLITMGRQGEGEMGDFGRGCVVLVAKPSQPKLVIRIKG